MLTAQHDQTINCFLASLKRADTTKRSYRETLELFVRQRGQLPENAADVQEWLDSQSGKRPGTLATRAAACRRYLTWIGETITRLELYPVIMPKPEYLSRDEITRLLVACETPMQRALVAVLYDTGARIGEVLRLTVADVNPPDDRGQRMEGVLRVIRKGEREDYANITPWGMDYLTAWLTVRKAPHQWIFCLVARYRYGVELPKVIWERLQYEAAYVILKNLAAKVGISSFHPHMLRHSRAVHLNEQGVDFTNIGYQLGHKNPEMARTIYGRPKVLDLKTRIPAPEL